MENEKIKFRILSLEASDIAKNNCDIKLPDKKNDYYYKCFSNILDWSLEIEELQKVHQDKIRHRFFFADENENKYTLAIVNVKFTYTLKDDDGAVVLKTSDLREKLYKDGFCIDGKKYVRYKRSVGSSRQGKCLFIRKEMLKEMEKWSNCGLKDCDGDLAGWESYRSLSLSSIKGMINIPIESILFVDDYKSRFVEKAISVADNGNDVVSEEKDTEIENNIWDGESLLDDSMFVDKYSDKHMLLLRNKFFKSCAFRTMLQQWFKDNNITTVDQLEKCGGITLAKNIEDIKMVTTPSSLKFLKFKKNILSEKTIKAWADNVDSRFGVVKWDKRTKFLNGRMVQSSYQFLNTVNLSKEKTEELLFDDIELLKKLKCQPSVLRYYFTDLTKREVEYADFVEDGLYRRGEIIFRLLNINDGFLKTKLFDTFRNDTIKKVRDNFKEGHLLLHGINATLFGNGPELLLSIIGKFDGESVALKNNEICCYSFENGEEVLCARSPHITMGNLYLAQNKMDSPMWQYFNLGTNIVCVNSINENLEQRLNGCDFDSDMMLITNERILIESAKKYYDEFLVPVCSINPIGKTDFDIIKLDIVTSNNKIGDIVNMSQLLNSLLWDKINNGCEFDKIADIYKDICILAVLSGIEIDKAKRTFSIDTNHILNRLREKYKNQVCDQPLFFKVINQDGTDKSYKKYLSTMDNIYQLVPEMSNFKKGKQKEMKFEKISSMFDGVCSNTSKTNYNKRDKIIETLDKYKQLLNIMYANIRISEDADILYEQINELKAKRDLKIKSLIENVDILKLVIKQLEKNDDGDWHIYSALFKIDNPMVEELFKKGKTAINRLIEDKNGDIEICGFKFKEI